MIRTAWNWLADEPHHRVGARLLQIAIGATVIFRVLTELPFASYLWGPHGIGLTANPMYFGSALGGLVDGAFHSMWGTYGLLLALLVGGVGLLTGHRTRAATAITLLATLMFERRLPEILDGGDNITRLALIYMLFLLPARARPVRQSAAVWFHNIAVVAIIAQLIVLYGTSGLMKAAGQKWHHGTALYVVSQVEWFSVPWVRSFFKNPFFVTLATYSTLLFQVWFPIAVFSRFKLIWLAAGMFFHLNIAVVMGLVTFSTVMIGLELFLITDEEFAWLKGIARERARALLRRLGVVSATAAPDLVLYIDDHCAHCRRTGELLGRLDVAARLSIRSFRHGTDYRRFGILPEALEKRMHAVSVETGRVWAGVAAVRVVARRLVLLWPLRPLLWLLDAVGLGERAYDAIASRRILIADARACHDGACARPGADDDSPQREVA